MSECYFYGMGGAFVIVLVPIDLQLVKNHQVKCKQNHHRLTVGNDHVL